MQPAVLLQPCEAQRPRPRRRSPFPDPAPARRRACLSSRTRPRARRGAPPPMPRRRPPGTAAGVRQANWCLCAPAGASPVKGKANHHLCPEPCVGHREVPGEASVCGECVGRATERRNRCQCLVPIGLECRGLPRCRRQHPRHRHGEAAGGSTASENHGMHIRTTPGPGRPPDRPGHNPGPHGEGKTPKPMMHGLEESYSAIVPMKSPNKCGGDPIGGGDGGKGRGQREPRGPKHAPGTEPGSA